EWASEGKQKFSVCEPERFSVKETVVCWYELSGCCRIKQGGTARVKFITLVPAIVGTGVFCFTGGILKCLFCQSDGAACLMPETISILKHF
ncbi:MAG: hypothetical protein IJS17_00045, partial [Clostridia bacterium]|nr:hypothetical protein [Clostridia bacterium]